MFALAFFFFHIAVIFLSVVLVQAAKFSIKAFIGHTFRVIYISCLLKLCIPSQSGYRRIVTSVQAAKYERYSQSLVFDLICHMFTIYFNHAFVFPLANERNDGRHCLQTTKYEMYLQHFLSYVYYPFLRCIGSSFGLQTAKFGIYLQFFLSCLLSISTMHWQFIW